MSVAWKLYTSCLCTLHVLPQPSKAGHVQNLGRPPCHWTYSTEARIETRGTEATTRCSIALLRVASGVGEPAYAAHRRRGLCGCDRVRGFEDALTALLTSVLQHSRQRG